MRRKTEAPITPRRFRKKPVVVEAMCFDTSEVVRWLHEHDVEYALVFNDQNNQIDFIELPTLEGPVFARRGDWIIRGIKGEFYPCKPDIFEQTYELVEAEA